MNNEKKVSVERERPFSAHHMLLGAAQDALSEENIDKRYSPLVAITMSALAIESLCNTIGERTVSDWKDFESSSPTAKLRIICDELGIDYDANKEPWSTVVWLSKLRNKLAHPKPDQLNESYEWSQEEYTSNYNSWPESKLEKTLTKGNAKRAHEKITELKYLLCKYIPITKSSNSLRPQKAWPPLGRRKKRAAP